MSGAPLFTPVIFMKQYFITLLMFVLDFVLFFNLFSLVIFMKVAIFHHIVDACVEFYFLKKQFLNLTINMQLLYCDQPSSFSHAPSACGVQCSTERLVKQQQTPVMTFIII